MRVELVTRIYILLHSYLKGIKITLNNTTKENYNIIDINIFQPNNKKGITVINKIDSECRMSNHNIYQN